MRNVSNNNSFSGGGTAGDPITALTVEEAKKFTEHQRASQTKEYNQYLDELFKKPNPSDTILSERQNMPIGGGCDVNRAGGNASLALICSKDVCMDITEPNRSSQKMTTNIDAILSERQKTHGDFASVANTYARFQRIYRNADGYKNMTRSQKLALDMIAVKISRMLNGNANDPQHAEDIAGYATLIVRELEANPL